MRAVFLDRDGVINKYPGHKKYVTRLEDFKLLPGAKEAVAKLSKKKWKIFIASNQAGVGKGLYSQRTLDAITTEMLKQIKKVGGNITQVYYCTHRKEENCSCRKPMPGMFHAARAKYKINLKASFFIGDTIRDVEAAQAAGCSSILVLSGKEKLSRRKSWKIMPDFVFKDLDQAAEFILNKE